VRNFRRERRYLFLEAETAPPLLPVTSLSRSKKECKRNGLSFSSAVPQEKD
jgi:hypothetical protein